MIKPKSGEAWTVQAEGIQLNNNHVIQHLQKSEIDKYLGMEEGEGIKENS